MSRVVVSNTRQVVLLTSIVYTGFNYYQLRSRMCYMLRPKWVAHFYHPRAQCSSIYHACIYPNEVRVADFYNHILGRLISTTCSILLPCTTIATKQKQSLKRP